MPKGDETKKDYEILGLENSASEDDVKRSFMKLALKFHPDQYTRPPLDETFKSRYHEVCKAYKRITTGDRTILEWNCDMSDEIFFSLVREILHATMKSGSLYSLFSSMPNHDTSFQDDNEYRCQEDALDDENEETYFNKLLDILKNRLQNGKSVPAGLTKEKIVKLKEEFAKQKDASKRLVVEKGATAVKKPSKTVQVPITKPKPKTKKQLLAEQRRREKEMAKIAAELEEKKKKESEKDSMKKQLEAEKQRKLDEELKKQEEERRREFQEAKKKKEREEREKEARLQKERDKQEKLRRQQEEEQRRKEEEKKRKAEEKAVKAKSLKDAKDKEEKEKAEAAKKAQQAKRQQQYQQYQQQQQKYPREVPPRFLRQQQMKQQQSGLPQPQEQQQDGGAHKQAKKKEMPQFSSTTVIPTSESKVESGNVGSSWSETESRPSEMWGQEIAQEAEAESSWGGVPVTEDWDPLPTKPTEAEITPFRVGLSEVVSCSSTVEEHRSSEPPPIGSELKEGKVTKTEGLDQASEVDASSSPCQRLGTFGAVGERYASTSTLGNLPGDSLLTVNGSHNTSLDHVGSNLVEKMTESTQIKQSEYLKSALNDSSKFTDVKSEHIFTDSSSAEVSGNSTWNKAPCRPRTNLPSTISPHINQSSSGPKLTDWSGLDAFEPVSSHISTDISTGVTQTNVSTINKKPLHVNTGVTSGDKCIDPKSYNMNPQPFAVAVQTPSTQKSHHTKDLSLINVSASQSDGDLSEGLLTGSTIENDLVDSVEKSQNAVPTAGVVGDEEDDYGWTTASRKAKKNPTPAASGSTKDANVWVSRSLKQLLDMGFQREEAERALRENNGIIESAVSDLLAGGDTKSTDGKINPRSLEKEEIERPSSCETTSLSVPPTGANGQPKLNRKQRRKLLQQQELHNSRGTELGGADDEGEWKLVTRERNVPLHSAVPPNESPTSKLSITSEPPISKLQCQSNSGREPLRPTTNTSNGHYQQSQTRSVSLKAAMHPVGLKAGIGSSELSKSLPLLSDAAEPKVSNDVTQLASDSTSSSASPRSSGSQSPSLSYSHLLQASVLNNLPFKSLSTDRLQQSVSSHLPLSTASHLFYSDPQLLPDTTASQPLLRPVNQGLHKGTVPVASSSVGSQKGIGSSPFSLMHILNAQPSLVNSVVAKPIDSVKSNFQLTDQLSKVVNPIAQEPGQLPALDHQPAQATAFHNPLPFTTAPQQSKLHQWKQPINSEHQDDVEVPVNRMQGPGQNASEQPLNASGAVNVAVTVDPVSAKWGVVAAPRLSPTPSEFKPGVPWKPRSEVEKEAKEKALEYDKEGGSVTLAQSNLSLTAESNLTENATSVGELTPVSSELSKAIHVENSGTLIAETVRPPPGLSDSYAFQNLAIKSSGDKVSRGEVLMENAHPLNNWLVLKDFSEKVEPTALKSLCQTYGNVIDVQLAPGYICIAFELPKQAAEACKVFNGNMIFDTSFTAEVVTEEQAVALLPTENWNRLPESSTPPVPPIVTMNQRMPGLWVAPNQLGPDPTCVIGPPSLGRPVPMNVFEMPSPLTQWSGLSTDSVRAPGPFWPLQPGPFLPQVPIGPMNLPTQSVTGNGNVVSPSMTKFLPDGLFNGSESA